MERVKEIGKCLHECWIGKQYSFNFRGFQRGRGEGGVRGSVIKIGLKFEDIVLEYNSSTA